jgi:DNA-binding transcriptional LysR family regulator
MGAARRLVDVLPEWTRPDAPVHAVFPSSRLLTPKVRAFVDLAKVSFEASLAAAGP